MTHNVRSPSPPSDSLVSSTCTARPRTLMESLLVAKMEKVGCSQGSRSLVRTDSIDSTSSFGSVASNPSSDFCRCDDCLLGITDFFALTAQEEQRNKEKKKVGMYKWHKNLSHLSSSCLPTAKNHMYKCKPWWGAPICEYNSPLSVIYKIVMLSISNVCVTSSFRYVVAKIPIYCLAMQLSCVSTEWLKVTLAPYRDVYDSN